jgi:hypothetical protein
MPKMNDNFYRDEANTKPAKTDRLFDEEKYKAQIELVKQDIEKEKFFYLDIIDEFNQSLFPLLIRCLENSENYKKALEGQLGEPYAGVAADLGDVFAFKGLIHLWWFMHGKRVFGEFKEFNKVRPFFADQKPKSEAFKLDFIIKVPLSLNRKDAIHQFTEIFDEQRLFAKAIGLLTDKPKRQLFPDQRLRRQTIENMLNVWEEHKYYPNKPWWKIGEELKISSELITNELDDEEVIKHKNRMMTLTVQRLYRMAGNLIEFAAQGDFPRVK